MKTGLLVELLELLSYCLVSLAALGRSRQVSAILDRLEGGLDSLIESGPNRVRIESRMVQLRIHLCELAADYEACSRLSVHGKSLVGPSNLDYYAFSQSHIRSLVASGLTEHAGVALAHDLQSACDSHISADYLLDVLRTCRPGESSGVPLSQELSMALMQCGITYCGDGRVMELLSAIHRKSE